MYSTRHPLNRENFGHQFHVCFNPSVLAHELRIIENIPGGPNKTMCARVVWADAKEGDRIPPTISFPDCEGNPMQGLMDALWDSGLRPSSDRVVDNEPILDAKDAHIYDLRTLLFHHLGVEK